ncbi:MAG: urease accessory protein UreD [Alphaproteobacteria bacterium]
MTRGAVEIAFRADDGATRLAHLYQRAPLRALFPQPARGDLPVAMLTNTAGGLVGGDELTIGVHAGAGCAAMACAQAAEKVYRSTGPDCRVEVSLTVEDGAWLEWLPQETILFDGARLRRRTAIDIAADARLLAGEMLVFGRVASGERFNEGLVRDEWEVRRAGRLVWADALHMDGDIESILDSPAGFAGATAAATLIYVGEDAPARLTLAREELAGSEMRVAASCVGGILLVRWLAADALALRDSYGRLWAALRHRIAGLPARLPVLWHV